MPRPLVAVLGLAGALSLVAAASAQQPVTFGSLLREMVDLERLTRWPDPDYRTVQFSSTDRRTVAPHLPGWFANSDGFGLEAEPNFERVLRAPDDAGVGEYLVCDVEGPGAIVRTWSAAMDGVLRVWLDDAAEPLFEGRAAQFFRRKARVLLPGFANLPAAVQERFEQQDADYLPLPFARRLRITWTGRVRDVHFYAVQVRRYAAGADVTTATRGVLAAEPVELPAEPEAAPPEGRPFAIEPGGLFVHEARQDGGGELTLLRVALANQDAAATDAWRTTRLCIAFDGSPVPQVDVPLGDFAGAGPWLAPLQSAAFTTGDGRLECRWPMPFATSCRVELHNHGERALAGELQWRVRQRPFDDASLWFHALWRVDHALHARGGRAPVDLPYLTALGRGRLVGLACALVNPPMHPSWQSNWWGEGDEKIRVDGELTTLGTGTEDYFDYSWSHWRYFAHPYCGQPLATGPGNLGHVANHRLQLLDDLPFAQSLHAAMELWSHREAAPVSYARLAWFYARPGVVTDHRALQPADLIVPALQPWRAADLEATPRSAHWLATADGIERVPSRLVRSGSVLRWRAEPGATLEFPFAVPEDGRYRVRVCCEQRPDAPPVRLMLDDAPLRQGETDVFALACAHGERFEDLVFADLDLAAGSHRLVLGCPGGGTVGVDLIGWDRQQPPAVPLPGAVEAELWDVVRKSVGLEIELQHLGPDWSASHQRWVKATRVGDAVTFRLPADPRGKADVVLRLTKSWDFGAVRVDWNGTVAVERVDLWCGTPRRVGIVEVDLGERDLTEPAELTFTVVGHDPRNEAPHCYFGIDCILVRR